MFIHQGAVYRRAATLPSSFPTWEKFQKEVIEGGMMDAEIEAYSEEYGNEFSEEEVEQLVLREYENRYWDAVADLERVSSGDDVWRGIILPEGIDPQQIDPVGRYWTQLPDAAWSHIELAKQVPVLFRARVDATNVDFPGTLWPRVFKFSEEDATEVRFHLDSPIYVYDVTLEDGTVLPINDWRTT